MKRLKEKLFGATVSFEKLNTTLDPKVFARAVVFRKKCAPQARIFLLVTVSTMMTGAKKSVKGNFLDFLRGCSSIFGGWGVVLPERTGCQFRPPEGGSPLLPPPFVYCD